MPGGKKVRIAIVGMGIGKPNGRALSGHSKGEVVALCDLDSDRMTEFAKELRRDLKFYTDYKAMCRDPEIDAVFVGTPNQWHVPVALEAIKRDKHVLVTKPLADSERAAKRLVKAAEASGVVNMMSLSTRFGPACSYLSKLSREEYFGELYYARARSVRRSGIPAWNLGFIREGGGAFRDMGVHVLDAVWAILGFPTPETVTGVAGAKFGPRGIHYLRTGSVPRSVARQFKADDYAGGFIRFENGIGLQIESFWASHQPGEFQIELFGTDAGATLSPLTLFRSDGQTPLNTSVDLPRGGEASWNAIADHFITSVLEGKQASAPLRHGLIVQQMMEGLLKSANDGKELRLKIDP